MGNNNKNCVSTPNPMATLARWLRQRLGVTSMFMLSGVVATLCCGAPAFASDFIPIFIPLPPPVQFTNNGTITGTLQTLGITLPFKGTLDDLVSGGSARMKLDVSVDAGGRQITRDSWVTTTPTVINEWEIVSTDPTTCREEVLSGDSYPQCTAWQNPSPNQWNLECTVTVQGNKATLDFQYTLTGNFVASLVEMTTISGISADVIKITLDSQGSFPPDQSVFDLPSICTP